MKSSSTSSSSDRRTRHYTSSSTSRSSSRSPSPPGTPASGSAGSTHSNIGQATCEAEKQIFDDLLILIDAQPASSKEMFSRLRRFLETSIADLNNPNFDKNTLKEIRKGFVETVMAVPSLLTTKSTDPVTQSLRHHMTLMSFSEVLNQLFNEMSVALRCIKGDDIQKTLSRLSFMQPLSPQSESKKPAHTPASLQLLWWTKKFLQEPENQGVRTQYLFFAQKAAGHPTYKSIWIMASMTLFAMPFLLASIRETRFIMPIFKHCSNALLISLAALCFVVAASVGYYGLHRRGDSARMMHLEKASRVPPVPTDFEIPDPMQFMPAS